MARSGVRLVQPAEAFVVWRPAAAGGEVGDIGVIGVERCLEGGRGGLAVGDHRLGVADRGAQWQLGQEEDDQEAEDGDAESEVTETEAAG